jgi:haloalkane dehalogenase
MLIEERKRDLPEWLRELYPFRTRTLQLQSCCMSFVDEGPAEAPIFVLLHGNPAWSFLYRDLIARLREQNRVIAPDHIGFGLSDKPAVAYHTLEQHIANLTWLIEAHQLRDLTLVTNGWGGPIGLGYAVAHPENIARLILTNTWGVALPLARTRKQPLGMRIAESGRLGALLDAAFNLTMHSAFASRTYRSISDMAMEAYTYPFPTAASRAAMSAFTRMFLHPDNATLEKLREIHSKLKNLDTPATILYGARDPLLTRLPAYLLRDELKRATEPVFLPNVGHYVPEESPEALAEAVLQQPRQPEASAGESVFRIIG